MVWTFPFCPKSQNFLQCWFKFLKVFCFFFFFSDSFLQLCSCWQKIESTIEHTHKVLCVCAVLCFLFFCQYTILLLPSSFLRFASVAITGYGKILPLREASLSYCYHPININRTQNNFMVSLYSPYNFWTRKLVMEATKIS